MQLLRWQPGPLAGLTGPVYVSATRFTYRRLWHMPAVIFHGLGLRRDWPRTEGAVGVSIGADLWRRTTYTVSVWRSEADLQRWLRSPAHLRLMRDFRGRLESSDASYWTTTGFRLREAWGKALDTLAPA